MFADKFVEERGSLPVLYDFSVSFQVFGTSLKMVDGRRSLLDEYFSIQQVLGRCMNVWRRPKEGTRAYMFLLIH